MGQTAGTLARRPRAWQRALHALSSWPPLVTICLLWLIVAVFIAVAADWLAPYPYAQIDLRARLQPPAFLDGSWAHALGTDELGRDVQSCFRSQVSRGNVPRNQTKFVLGLLL